MVISMFTRWDEVGGGDETPGYMATGCFPPVVKWRSMRRSRRAEVGEAG